MSTSKDNIDFGMAYVLQVTFASTHPNTQFLLLSPTRPVNCIKLNFPTSPLLPSQNLRSLLAVICNHANIDFECENSPLYRFQTGLRRRKADFHFVGPLRPLMLAHVDETAVYMVLDQAKTITSQLFLNFCKMD